jgi:hypothetical protein
MTFDYEAAARAEREACARLVEADGLARGAHGYMLIKAAARIRARGEFSKPLDNAVHASDMSQERVDEIEKSEHEWVGLTDEERAECWSTSAVQSALNIEAKLKEKNNAA